MEDVLISRRTIEKDNNELRLFLEVLCEVGHTLNLREFDFSSSFFVT